MAGYLLAFIIGHFASIFPLLESSNNAKSGKGVYADRKMNEDHG